MFITEKKIHVPDSLNESGTCIVFSLKCSFLPLALFDDCILAWEKWTQTAGLMQLWIDGCMAEQNDWP